MRLVWAAAFLSLLMCGGVLSVHSQQKIHKDLMITLERSQCYGWCPSYSLTIKFDGVVKFTPLGTKIYRSEGEEPKIPFEGSITVDQLNALLTEFQKIKFYSLRKQYGSAGNSETGRSCPEYATDNPSATITIKENGRKKTVYHYLGCSGLKILDDLNTLELKIDEIVGVKRWTSQYSWGSASVLDVKLKKVPLPTTKPQ